MTDTIGVGIIGAGWHAQQILIPAIQRCQGMRIVALAVGQAASAGAVHARFGYPTVVGHDALLRRDGVDAVVIATPATVQTEITIAALQAGKHVFCETPGPRSVAEQAAVERALMASGRVLSYGVCLRYAPIYRHLRELLPALRAGGAVVLTIRYFAGLRHVVDLAHALLGDVARVVSWSHAGQQVGMLEFATGDLGVIHCGGPVHAGIPLEAVEVSGAGGVASARGSRELVAYHLSEPATVDSLTFDSAPATVWAPSPSITYGALNPLELRGYTPELAAFAAAIHGGASTPSGIAQIGRAIRVEAAIARSAATGQPMDVEG